MSGMAAATETLQGEVERLVYSGDETGYTVCRLTVPGARDPVTVVGSLPGIQPGERLHLEGRWTRHPRYGLQFQAARYTSRLPASATAIRRYLGSNLVRGIGPVLAERLVGAFGEETLEVIEQAPERLRKISGIGPARIRQVQQAWEAQRALRAVMLFLQEHGVTSAYATRIYRAYGDAAVARVREDPYRLARDIRGIGFKTADRIAQQLGIAPDSPLRARAALEHTLGELADEGHVYVPAGELLESCARRVELPRPLLEQALEDLLAHRHVVRVEEAVYLPALYRAERGAASLLRTLLHTPLRRRAFDPDRAVAWAEERGGVRLSPTQREAVRLAVTSKVAVVSGGPGTGKTTILRAVLAILEVLKEPVVLAAPTGRAAKRLGEATGREARTLHRLLDFQPGQGRFSRDRDHPLEAGLVVVDEVSMVDISLLYALLRAVPATASLLLVGDADQLPSVGPGAVLRDVLESGAVPAVRLTEVFRQGEGSRIVEQAHRINGGKLPEAGNREPSDFYVVREEDPERAAELVVELCARRIPRRFGLDPVRDVQVLCPMNRGSAGAVALNARLQEELNPRGPGVSRFGRRFREGDRVLQTVNNYEKRVFNGDLGWVRGIALDEGSLRVGFEEREVAYGFGELDELVPAYAMTVHRAQGSEFPAVVVPVLTQHYPMLQRNLLYTAVTRARELAVIMGDWKALGMAVRSKRGRERYTSLAAWLEEPG